MMRAIHTLIKKELKDLFFQPVAFIFLCVFLFVSFWFFFSTTFTSGQTSLRPYFDWLPLLFVFFLPAITMSKWTDEIKSGTQELLFTLPVSEACLVWAKFIASLIFIGFILLITTPLVITFHFLGDLDLGVVTASYLGTFLLAACYLALGLWVSSLVKNQIVAFMISAFILFLFYFIGLDLFLSYLPYKASYWFQYISFSHHFESIKRGVIDTRDLVYFLSVSLFFVYLNVFQLSLKSRKTKQKTGLFIITTLILCIIFCLNAFSLNVFKRFDFTQEKEFTLSSTTNNNLNLLKDQLTITFYSTKEMPPILKPIKNSILDFLFEIKSVSKQNIIIKHQDPAFNQHTEEQAQELGIVPLELNIKEKDNIEVKKIYMGLGLNYLDKNTVVPVAAQLAALEYKFNLALLNTLQQEKAKIGIAIGSKKEAYQFITTIIQETGIPVSVSPDLTGVSHKDLDALLLIAPQNLSHSALTELDSLLENGIPVIIFAGKYNVSNTLQIEQITTGLDDWLIKKGVAISNELMLDIKQNEQVGFQQNLLQVFVPYPFWIRALHKDVNNEHPITANLEEIIFPWAHAILLSNNQTWESNALVYSSTNSFLQNEDSPKVNPDYVDNMSKMPTLTTHPLAVITTNTNKKTGQLFIIGSHHMLQDIFLSKSQANILFLTNILEHAALKNSLINLRTRGKTTRPLKHLSEQNISFIKWGHIIGIPFICFIFIALLFGIKKIRQKQTIKRITS